MKRTPLLATLAALAMLPLAADAQSRDSIPHWTARLSRGPLHQRVDAARKLAGFDARSLPPETKRAFIAELNRINDVRMAGEPVEGTANGYGNGNGNGNGNGGVPPETFGLYYIDLVATTVALNTEESENAVVRAVAVSGGLQRRVARRGDTVTPMLVEMIERGYEAGAAVETLGLIWFHADSAGERLLPATRAEIVRRMIDATRSTSVDVRRSAVLALRSAGDPALLPLAEHFGRRAAASNDRMIIRAVQHENVIPLRRANRSMRPAELLRRVTRVADAICHGAAGARRESCELLRSRLAATGEGISRGDRTLARAALLEAREHVEAARAAGSFDEDEHALLAGGILMLIDRHR